MTYSTISLPATSSVDAAAAITDLVNRSLITGTNGASYAYSGNGGTGGGGVDLDSGQYLANDGTINGGTGGASGHFLVGSGNGYGGNGGAGVLLTTGSKLNNHGTIRGGAGGNSWSHNGGNGGVGVDVASRAALDNFATINGGWGGYSWIGNGGQGGNGIDLAARDTLTNHGTVTGGGGGDGFQGDGGAAGVGIDLGDGATLTNDGTITGGTGGDADGKGFAASLGGNAIDLGTGCTFTNSGQVTGGTGGYDLYGTGGTGGDGVYVAAGATLTNNGAITGGSGGRTLYGTNGNGGIGVYLATGATLTNSGEIAGGAGAAAFHFIGYSSVAAGDQGVGVYINGGTLIDSGSIAGNCAVEFGAKTGTLEIDPGAIFTGAVTAHANDLLKLGGNSQADLSSLGSAITGFGQMLVEAQADWVLQGANHLGSGTIAIQGDLAVAGWLQTRNLNMNGGRLQLDHGGIVIGGNAAGRQTGMLLVKQFAAITGFGTIAGSNLTIIDDGQITADGGKLLLNRSVTGSGKLSIDPSATLVVNGALSVSAITFISGGRETLVLDHPTETTSPLIGFTTGDHIDLRSILATSADFIDHTLKLYDGANLVDEIQIKGAYTNSNFLLGTDHLGGTLIDYSHN